MTLEVQIQSFVYSFLYGMFFSLMLNLHYTLLFQSKKWVQIILSFLFLLDHVLVYFIFLRWINQGIFHPYFLLLLYLGYFVGNHTTKKLRGKWFSSFST